MYYTETYRIFEQVVLLENPEKQCSLTSTLPLLGSSLLEGTVSGENLLYECPYSRIIGTVRTISRVTYLPKTPLSENTLG